MVLSIIQSADETEAISSIFASRYVHEPLPRYKMPKKTIPKEVAYQIIHDELMLDGNPRLNLASFVTTWMEPECDKLMSEAINKNYVDMDEYPNRCVNMIGQMFHAPSAKGKHGTSLGVATVGSSEAIMLAGLAFKKKWQNKRKAEGKPYDRPNIVTGANVQVCWEKFARYFDVELKEVKLTERCFVMDPVKAVELVDENTICVAAILGSTLNGEFEDVKLWNTPIHVDAASGGFVAPFVYPDLEWDFRLPLVKSINVSGHKYGLVYAGVGWVIWRSKDDLPEELVFHINYLGADQPTFTLNFSKGASQIVAQYYQFLRMGFEGYKHVIENCIENARTLRKGLEKTGRFEIVSKDQGIPLVAFAFKHDDKSLAFDLSKALRHHGWIVPAYTMPADIEHMTILRVVVREDFGRQMVDKLLSHIKQALVELKETVPRLTFTVEVKPSEGDADADMQIAETSVHWTKDKHKMFHKEVKVTGGKTKGVC
ncbi:Glutamate decarboxylase [Bienertia sinuspersici]